MSLSDGIPSTPVEEEVDNRSIIDRLWDGIIDFNSWSNEFLGGKHSEDEDFDPELVLSKIPINDLEAGRIIQDHVGRMLTHIAEESRWYVWDGRIHIPVESDVVAREITYKLYDALNETIREVDVYYESIARRFRGSKDDNDKKKLAEVNEKIKKVKEYRWYKDNIASNRGSVALTKVLESLFHKDSDFFDKDTDYFVVKNGVFLTNVFDENGWPKLVRHSPERAVSKYYNAEWNPGAYYTVNDSKFMKFLRSSVEGGSKEHIEFLQKATGASFLGRNKLRSIINLIGPPSSGKSLFIETIWKPGTRGSGYCVMPNSSAITRQQQNWEQSRFRGKRMIAISEPDAGKEVDDDFLKRFTGDVWVETRNLREKSHGWTPQGMLFIASNDYLKINTRDKAIVDRIHIIEFPYHFVPNPDPQNPKEKLRNTYLTDELQTAEERSNILFWIVDGMRKFHLDGESINPPESIKNASNKVVTEGSAATRWIADQVENGNMVRETIDEPYGHIKLSEAWSDFSIWNSINNEHSRLSKSYFEKDISQWYEIKRHGGDKYIIGLRKTHKGSYNVNNNQEVLA